MLRLPAVLIVLLCLSHFPVSYTFPRLNLLKKIYGRLIHRANPLPDSVQVGATTAGDNSQTCPNAPGYFFFLGSTTVSGIHTAITYKGTILIIDRTDVANTNAKFPKGSPQAGKTVYAEEFDPATWTFRPLDVKTNVFCSSGTSIEDGTILSIGGASDASNIADPMLNGSFSIRSFTPCDSASATCDFTLVGNMTTKRWYPTAQLMPDGRVLIVGGANVYGNIAQGTANTIAPNYEFWPRAAKEGNYPLSLLTEANSIAFNLYPFVHLLPSGNVFIFAGQNSVVLNALKNQVVTTLPVLDQQHPKYSGFKAGMDRIFRSYPTAGTSVMFTLDPAKGYRATVMICGGNYDSATAAKQGMGVVATDICASINPEDTVPTWVYEKMPTTRVMPDAVLLLDDVVLIINGAQKGFEGLKPTYATVTTRVPHLYNTSAPFGSRFLTLGAAPLPPFVDHGINRVYHSSALLMPDATVLITGSNPNPYFVPLNPSKSSASQYPTEFRTQLFLPHYLQYCISRNIIAQAPASISHGGTFQVTLNSSFPTPSGLSDAARFRVVLAHPGFSTHAARHGMRNVILVINSASVLALTATVNSTNSTTGVTTSTTVTTYQYSLTISAPTDGNKAPATYYWLHVLDQGGFTASGKWVPGRWVPSTRGPAVRVMRANGVVSSAVTEARITRWDNGTSGGGGSGRRGRWWRRFWRRFTS